MLTIVKNIYNYRELISVLAWRNVATRYKQAYLGVAWAVLRPLLLMLLFVMLRSLIGIDSGKVPYPVLSYAALTLWTFFQDATTEGVNSVVVNAPLVRKIYFPREIFPLTSVLTKLVDLAINFLILGALMVWYGVLPGIDALWMPLLVLYTVLISLTVAFIGSAANVYYRDISAAVPLVLSLLMYMSPVIYPLEVVKKKLVVEHAAGEWSDALYTLYTLNPLAGLIDASQNVLLRSASPDLAAMWPGMLLVCLLLPLSYLIFKRAEVYFADVI